MAHAGADALTHQHMAHIYAGLAGCLQQGLTEQVIPHAAHHGDVRSQAGTLEGLVGALAAGSHMEGFSVYGLGGGGDLFRSGDNVHDKAADD